LAEVNNPEVGQMYRSAGWLRDRKGKGQNQEGEKRRDWEKQELRLKDAG
jgi:hypothetical protein